MTTAERLREALRLERKAVDLRYYYGAPADVRAHEDAVAAVDAIVAEIAR